MSKTLKLKGFNKDGFLEMFDTAKKCNSQIGFTICGSKIFGLSISPHGDINKYWTNNLSNFSNVDKIDLIEKPILVFIFEINRLIKTFKAFNDDIESVEINYDETTEHNIASSITIKSQKMVLEFEFTSLSLGFNHGNENYIKSKFVNGVDAHEFTLTSAQVKEIISFSLLKTRSEQQDFIVFTYREGKGLIVYNNCGELIIDPTFVSDGMKEYAIETETIKQIDITDWDVSISYDEEECLNKFVLCKDSDEDETNNVWVVFASMDDSSELDDDAEDIFENY